VSNYLETSLRFSLNFALLAPSTVISGGLDLSPVTDNDPHINPALYPSPTASNVPPPTSTYQPGHTPTFSHPSAEPPTESVHRPHAHPPSATLSPTSFFKTPSYFWNQAVPSAMTTDRAGGGGGGIDPSALQTQIGDFGQGFVSSPSTWTTPAYFLDGSQPVGGGGGGGMYDSVGLTNQDGPVVRSLLLEHQNDTKTDLPCLSPARRTTRCILRWWST
jgi:hypothetical protein